MVHNNNKVFFGRDLLLGEGEHGSLVHLHVVDPHPTEDCKGLHKVLVVGGEGQVVEL